MKTIIQKSNRNTKTINKTEKQFRTDKKQGEGERKKIQENEFDGTPDNLYYLRAGTEIRVASHDPIADSSVFYFLGAAE